MRARSSTQSVQRLWRAITVVDAVIARNVEGHQYASTIVYAVGARNVEGVKYASMVVDAISARNAKGVKNKANGTEAEKRAIALENFPTVQTTLAR